MGLLPKEQGEGLELTVSRAGRFPTLKYFDRSIEPRTHVISVVGVLLQDNLILHGQNSAHPQTLKAKLVLRCATRAFAEMET
jgi:hypothetical protein